MNSFRGMEPRELLNSAQAGCFTCSLVEDSVKSLIAEHKIPRIKSIGIWTEQNMYSGQNQKNLLVIDFHDEPSVNLELFISEGNTETIVYEGLGIHANY